MNFYSCPICNAEFIDKKENYYVQGYTNIYCKNGCCKLSIVDGELFGIMILFDRMSDGCYTWLYNIERIIERIEYWKKDYRYLAEILVEDDI